MIRVTVEEEFVQVKTYHVVYLPDDWDEMFSAEREEWIEEHGHYVCKSMLQVEQEPVVTGEEVSNG